jgi:hypothetical protein
MPLAANALTTVENVQAFAQGVGEAIPPEHAITVEFMLNSVSAAVEEFCRRKFAKATYTSELHTGVRGQQFFYPHQWPINSVTSVKIDGTAITEDTDFADIDPEQWVKYKLPDGTWVALFRGGTWKSDALGIEITYNAGYVTPPNAVPPGTPRDLPYDLEEYAIRLVLGEYLHRGKQALSAESFAGMTLNFDRWPLDIVMGLRKHQKPLI